MDAHSYAVTDPVAGFEEGDILDVTARFGDWHEFDLQFDPQGEKRVSSTRVELTRDEFERATEPLTATA